MGVQERYVLARTAAETTYNLWELLARQEEPDLDRMMRRMKDLSAYSLTHAEIMEQREGVELLALAMFFGATSDPQFHKNQERLSLLSEDAISYQGRSETIEEQVAGRSAKRTRTGESSDTEPGQPRLL